MHLHRLAPSLLLLAACGGPTTTAPVATTTPAAPAAPAAPDLHAAMVERFEGVWVGDAVDSPMGDFRIAFAFDREPGGDLHGRLDDHHGMYVDLRFHRDGAAWHLVEEAAIPQVGVQRHTLVPVPAAAGARVRWVDRDAPAFLAVDVTATGAPPTDALALAVTLRGEPHVTFALRRVVGEDAERVRAALAGR